MDDTISRQSALDIVDELNSPDWYMEWGAEARRRLVDLPPAQLDIKQAAKLLSDFIESCPGGDSYLFTPDGEELRTDWGYATEGIQLIYDWAERREK